MVKKLENFKLEEKEIKTIEELAKYVSWKSKVLAGIDQKPNKRKAISMCIQLGKKEMDNNEEYQKYVSKGE